MIRGYEAPHDILDYIALLSSQSKPTASMEYTDSGDMDIQLSEGVTPDKNIDEELQELYLQTGKFIIGEELGEYVQEVELPEHQQRFR